MYSHGAAEVAISADDALWRASAKAGAAAMKVRVRPLRDSAIHSSDIHHPNVSQRHPRGPPPLSPLTRGRKGWKTGRILRNWRPGRAGAVPIIAPPPSRRRRSAPVIGGALATGDRRRDYLTRRALS